MNQTQFQKAAGISAGLAARWFPHITAAMKEFGITDYRSGNVHCSMGMKARVYPAGGEFNYSIAGLADFVRPAVNAGSGQFPRAQPGEPCYLERQRLSPIWSTASAWVTTGQLMAGFIAGADSFK
jgi:putative chitinase